MTESRLHKFKIGDVIKSDWDKPVLVIKLMHVGGFPMYKCLTLEPLDKEINGAFRHYNQASLNGFYVIGFNPAAATLFT